MRKKQRRNGDNYEEEKERFALGRILGTGLGCSDFAAQIR